MPLTPLHIAYVWPLGLRCRSLSFAALTIGSMIPDVENVVLFFIGLNPNRLVTHSLLGAFTVDIALTILACYLISKLGLERLGILGFSEFRVNGGFLVSACLGALTHVLTDYTHHEFNPILWPFGPTFVSGPLFEVLGFYGAYAVAQTASFLLFLYIVKKLLNGNGGLRLLLSNPKEALELISGRLSTLEKGSLGHKLQAARDET